MDKIYDLDAEYGKRGYLKENYRIFYNKEFCQQEFDFHYHEFEKLVLFKSGKASYIIEGKEYILKPYDILLVGKGDIHKPIISKEMEYERIIIWINSDYIKSNSLYHCFEKANENGQYLLRLPEHTATEIFDLADKFNKEKSENFASALMKDTIFIQLMILINRFFDKYDNIRIEYKSDKQTDSIIEYINKNIFENLSVDKISNEFFISRYYLMHKFKKVTGKTIYAYINSKRLMNAANLISKGCPAKTACFESGFNNYSVFLKAFKKEFGCVPTNYIQKDKA
ncbi:MAG: AraC family transcriptional regulator [Eubacterium sp.]|nr:AraC family transcriptional regulator [Eubacterium sp.]